VIRDKNYGNRLAKSSISIVVKEMLPQSPNGRKTEGDRRVGYSICKYQFAGGKIY